MVLLFYVDDCLIISNSKDKIDDLYASIMEFLILKMMGSSKSI